MTNDPSLIITNDKSYPVLRFNQYGSAESSDELLMFAAKARDLYAWAGIPRKGWQIRMLFQRPITPKRETELIDFWNQASQRTEANFIIGPTAIIIAIQDANISDSRINLSYSPLVEMMGETPEVASALAKLLIPSIQKRLSKEDIDVIQARQNDPFESISVEVIGHNYVFEFAIQLEKIAHDPVRFFEENSISTQGQGEIIEAMEALLRPAIVVDGQHRLYGAAHSDAEIMLPVVAIPHCSWSEQIYQFVVINEKAQRVDTSLLTDIFGSSLTPTEQQEIRKKLNRSNVDIEPRIAATIAGRTPGSPFENMVVVKMDGTPPPDTTPYISDRTIRSLIDGSSQRYSRGWRTDDEFYAQFIAPTFPDRSDWDSWSHGAWRDYWFAFWRTVRDHYNAQCEARNSLPIWSKTIQGNLTKAVTMRLFQSLFMEEASNAMKRIEENREDLIELIGDVALAEQRILDRKRDKALPPTIPEFEQYVKREFLKDGVPLKFFTATWKKSLDDTQGQLDLWDTMTKAYKLTKEGKSFYVRGQIFDANEE